MALIGYGLGGRIWKLLRVEFNSSLEEVIFSLALGWGALAYLVLGLGVGGLLYRGAAYGLLAILTLISLPAARRAFLRAAKKPRTPPCPPGANQAKRGEKIEPSPVLPLTLWMLLAVTLTVALIGALTPPLNYDALSYHLAFPAEFIRQGRIIHLPHQVYSNFPFTLQMLYLLSLLLHTYGDILAKLIHLSFGILTAAAIYAFARRYFKPRVALLASALFANIPLVGFLSTTALIDLGVTLYGFLALIGWINWFYSRKREDILVSAIFTGLAMGTKYPAILFSFLPLLLGIVLKRGLIDKSPWPGTLKGAFIFSLVALGIFSPWLIRNFINTGNPVYPLFYHFLGGRGWSAFNAARFMKHHTAPFDNWWEIFLIPLAIGGSKDIGPLFIIFAPLLIFFKRFAGAVKLLLAYGGVYFLLWIFFTHRDYRFLLPAFPVFSLVAAYLMMRFRRGKICSLLLMAGLGLGLTLNYQRFHLLSLHLLSFREGALLFPLSLSLSAFIVFLAINCIKKKSLSSPIVAGLALALLVNLSAVAAMIPRYGLLRVALGRESREEFLSRTLYAYDAFCFANENLPPRAKVLFIGENQRYYLDRDFVGNSPLDDNIIVGIVSSSRSGEEIRERLREMGITHILYNASEVKRVDRAYASFNWASEEARERFLQFFSGREYLREIFSRRGVSIYEIL